jgi:hypothetical protein
LPIARAIAGAHGFDFLLVESDIAQTALRIFDSLFQLLNALVDDIDFFCRMSLLFGELIEQFFQHISAGHDQKLLTTRSSESGLHLIYYHL